MKKHLIKCCTFFYFFFVEFQLYASLPSLNQLNPEEITSVKKSAVRQEKSSQDWSHIATLMNTIDKKEDKESLDKRGSKNFIGFFQAHYQPNKSQVVFDSFVKEYNIKNIKNKIARIIVKLPKEYIDKIELKKYHSIMIGLDDQEIKKLSIEQIKKLYISNFMPEQLSYFGENIQYFGIAEGKKSKEIIFYVRQNYKENQDNSKLVWLLTKISKNIIAQAESAWLLSLSEEQIVVFNVDQLCALANNNKIKFLGRHTFTDKSEKKILETIKSYWIDFTNVKLSKNKNANLKGNIAKKYKAIFNIINQLTLLNKDITQKWMKEIRIGLENALQDNYVISLDRESFVFSSIVGIVLAVIMANLSFFQFTGNTLIDITKGMAIFSINLGATLVSLFRGLLEKRKFIQKVMKEIDKGIP